MSARPDIQPGDFFRAEWPFERDDVAIRENREWREENAKAIALAGGDPFLIALAWEWKPGTRTESEPGTMWTECDAMGHAEFLVVAVCEMPGRYQDRVFYKRTLIDPDGKRWGGKDLKVAAIGRFWKWTKGWRPEIVVNEEYGEGEAEGLRLVAS